MFFPGDEHRTFNLTLRILTLLGAILALGGLAIMTLYFYQLDSRQEGKSGAIFSALCWFIDGKLHTDTCIITGNHKARKARSHYFLLKLLFRCGNLSPFREYLTKVKEVIDGLLRTNALTFMKCKTYRICRLLTV